MRHGPTGRARGRPRTPGLLTPAEERVLDAVREGRTNPQIAEDLGVSLTTVRYHLMNIYTKVGLSDRQVLASAEPDGLLFLDAGAGRRSGWALMPFLQRLFDQGWLGRGVGLAMLAVPAIVAAVLIGYWRRDPGPLEKAGPPASPAAPAGAVWGELRARPLAVTRIAPGAACPSTASGVPDGADPRVVSIAPLSVASTVAFSTILDGTGRPGTKLIWPAGDPAEPALVRGERLDGPGRVIFLAKGESGPELRLDGTTDSGRGPAAGNVASEVYVPATGCYTLQLDTPSRSETFVFRAVIAPPLTQGSFAAGIPDGSLDVCAWFFDGAKGDAQAVATSLDAVDRTALGGRLQLVALGSQAAGDCAGRPADAGIRGGQFLPQRTDGGGVSARRGAIDLWVFVVPQAAADSLGRTWRDRRVAWEATRQGDATAEVTSAVLIGDEELADAATLRRFLIVGLGLAEAPDARPNIDGSCVPSGDASCGTDPADAR